MGGVHFEDESTNKLPKLNLTTAESQVLKELKENTQIPIILLADKGNANIVMDIGGIHY